MSKDSLGDRMKNFYESRSKTQLTRRTPVIVRLDGRAFHSFCKRFEKPFDTELNSFLNNVTMFLCSKIQGAKFAERHSDEISILLSDYDKLNTDAFFDYEVQKICSVTASMATSAFIHEMIYLKDIVEDRFVLESTFLKYDEDWPQFDSRCFNIPDNEITNYFLWRQNDAVRNSIAMYAQSKFSSKQLHKKNSNQMQEMLFQEHGINWNDLPQERKSGFLCYKEITPDTCDRVKKWSIHPSPRSRDDLDRLIQSALIRDED